MENEAGSLSRVVGLFSQRGYNIDSLNVAATEDATISRLTFTTITTSDKIEQITKQLWLVEIGQNTKIYLKSRKIAKSSVS